MSVYRHATWALLFSTTTVFPACNGDDTGTVDESGATDTESTGSSTTNTQTSTSPTSTSDTPTTDTTSTTDEHTSSSTGSGSTGDGSTDDGSTSNGGTETGSDTSSGSDSTGETETETDTGDETEGEGGFPFIEDFDTTPAVPDAQRGWTASVFAEAHHGAGGNPDGHLRADPVGIFIPQFRTEYGLVNDYVGDKNYAEVGISEIAFDFNLISQVGGATEVPITLMLVNDGGTPNDQNDDTAAYYVSEQAPPQAGGGWVTYTFPIPSGEATLPDGWALYDMGGAVVPSIDWIDVITDVDRIVIWRGQPDFFYLLGDFSFGIDNISFDVE